MQEKLYWFLYLFTHQLFIKTGKTSYFSGLFSFTISDSNIPIDSDHISFLSQRTTKNQKLTKTKNSFCGFGLATWVFRVCSEFTQLSKQFSLGDSSMLYDMCHVSAVFIHFVSRVFFVSPHTFRTAMDSWMNTFDK